MYRDPMGNDERDAICRCDSCKRRLYPGAIAYEVGEKIFCQYYCEREAMDEIEEVYQDHDYEDYLIEVDE